MSLHKRHSLSNAIIFFLILLVSQGTLYSKKAKDSAPEIDTNTAFSLVKGGTFKEIKKAIKKDLSSVTDEEGDTLLMAAIKADRGEKIVTYLMKDADIDHENNAGSCAASYVCRYCSNERIVRAVLAKGIVRWSKIKEKLLHTDKAGITAYERALENPAPAARKVAFEYLTKKDIENIAMIRHNEMLSNEAINAAASIKDEGEVDIEAENKSNESILPPPVESNTQAAVPAPPAMENEKPNVLDTVSPYLGALYSSKYLYAYAADEEDEVDEESGDFIRDANKSDKDGVTPLMKAAKKGNGWEVNALLKSGADVNAVDKDGWNALMYAVRYQMNSTVVETLLNAGCNAQERNNYGFTPLSIAARYNENPAVTEELLKHFEAGDDEVFRSLVAVVSSPSLEEVRRAKVRIFMEHGVPLNRYWEGKTPLMYAAASCNSTETLRILLDNGAIASLSAADGKKAFDYAKANRALPHDEVFWSLNGR